MLAPKVYDFSTHYRLIWDETPRPMIRIAKEHFLHTSQLVGAEIGVSEGKNALSILQELPMKKLYLIDPYQSKYAKGILSPERVQWLVMVSEEAHKEIHESLDFCYIDGNHEYPYVRNDLKNYWPLIKPNGLLGGHDYWMDGVQKAVDEFAHENDLRLNIAFPDFWIAKP